MKVLDISRLLSAELAPWPGDVPFGFTANCRIDDGASVNLGMLTTSVHNGSHADARFHFESDGWTIDQAQLETYVGRAVVADLSPNYAGESLPPITIASLEPWADELGTAPRLLLKTNVWSDSRNFPERIPTITPDVPPWLQELGVKLLGLDLPSVDEITSKTLANHHALAKAGISIIESLDLRAVDAGRYHFAGLPLKIAGADGSPIRAVLWRD
jgi:arylformamidase